MKLYVTRHGQTSLNVEDKVCGQIEVDLTEKGIQQAEMLAGQIADKGIDLIITTSLSRARKTAEIVNQKLGVPILTDDRILEMDFGIYERVPRSMPEFIEAKRNFACRFPGGESVFYAVYRVYSFLEDIREKYADKTVLVVAHGSVCRILNSYFEDMKTDTFYDYILNNCELKCYEL